MNARGWSEGELARQAGVTQPTVHRIITGESKSPKRENIERIAKVLRVPSKWLWDGGPRPASEPAEPSNVAMIAQPERMYRYPVLSWVAAGDWSEAIEPGGSEEYELTDYKAKGPAFWLTVKGDSMTAPTAPSVPEGSQILVDTRADVRPGKLVIAKLADSNEATFKKLVEDGGIRYLKPLNPAYPTVQCSDDCKIIGVVVRSLTKFA
ncbi:Rophage PssSM-02, Cro/c1 family prophage repressor protein [Pseudomonas amygdali pv. lachrymans]|uniref:Rophage PssSM-02, Cro/c1 family prophage repressor protein n=2 Tax=Pseudomonas syringae group TaxID=136849 RepID=A0AB37R067_PSEAV|nr:Rophage PssSM-02 [Pseudomonas amygdali pv. lachrymans]RMM38840.1 Rophage PssSM-02, Cro/c1 family prophage repressor protein [Pseudomonas amygdali pv. lachrymans]RMU15537.1 Rophage PssSM-02, Cro/c1 family prophage repressor protein [Pseudomonas amygdali pv. lachrymans]